MDDQMKEPPGSSNAPPVKGTKHGRTPLIYQLDENPSPLSSLLLGFQEAMVLIPAYIAQPVVMAAVLCGDKALAVSLSYTNLAMCAIATFLQTTYGVRLPIAQGPATEFLLPVVIMAQVQPDWQCKAETMLNGTEPNKASKNMTGTEEPGMPQWHEHLLQIQGAQMLSALIQILVGMSGAMSVLLRHIGPLTIAPTISLLGLSLIPVMNKFAGQHWGVALFLLSVFVTFSLYLGNLNIPVPSYSRHNEKVGKRGCTTTRSKVFKLYPFLLCIPVTWLLCYVLTVTDVLPPGHSARTDANWAVVGEAPWLAAPYPGQYGAPSFSLPLFIALVFSTLSSIVESIGDYYVTARVCQVARPPLHAINRGILTEGVGCLVGGALGTGMGVTSASQHVGTLTVTGAGCRLATQLAAAFTLLASALPKFSALFAALPDPIMGGLLIIGFGMVTIVGLSTLQHVNMNHPRNVTVLGLTYMVGLCLPAWVHAHPAALETGLLPLDQTVTVLLGSSMFVGGVLGFFLDNTVPGASRQDRGLDMEDPEDIQPSPPDHRHTAYLLPTKECCGLRCVPSSTSCFRQLPFLPRHEEQDPTQDIVMDIGHAKESE